MKYCVEITKTGYVAVIPLQRLGLTVGHRQPVAHNLLLPFVEAGSLEEAMDLATTRKQSGRQMGCKRGDLE